jgi:predicted DsbA family dithiol-disulfide isomerase
VERWRAALRLLTDTATEVRWRYGAFELDPTVPREGVDRGAYMRGKYPPDMLEAVGERLARIARAEGLELLDLGHIPVRPNTFDAHRLLTAALDGGAELQQALADELFAAYWGRGENIGEAAVLTAAATTAGMPAERAGAVLGGQDYAAEVRAEQRLAAGLGIHAVPTFVIADRVMVTGAQPPQALADAVREALATA